ncbi:MAG: hypothetical protein KF816_10055 [Melioribacteraceae bacterium]|nr:hypothetical protein [Melioribacteraceae bacterium]
MQILLVAGVKNGWPFLEEFISNVPSNDLKFDVLDVDEFIFYSLHSNKKLSITPKIVKILLKIPRIKLYIKIIFIKIILYKIKDNYYDYINIHNITNMYRYLFTSIKKKGKYLVLSPWGSDFYRANLKEKLALERVYKSADFVVGNPDFIKDILEYYNIEKMETYDLRFGIEKLDLMRKIVANTKLENIRKKHAIPQQKISVMIGSNASSKQNHVKIIDELKSLEKNIIENCFFIIPMTYRKECKAYNEKIRKLISTVTNDYIIIDHFLDVEDLCEIKLITDVAIFMQDTDAFSSTVQEQLFANSLVILGDWLPYQVYKKLNIKFWSSELSNLNLTLISILKNFKDLKIVVNNREKIYRFSSWETVSKNWMDFFMKEYE